MKKVAYVKNGELIHFAQIQYNTHAIERVQKFKSIYLVE